MFNTLGTNSAPNGTGYVKYAAGTGRVSFDFNQGYYNTIMDRMIWICCTISNLQNNYKRVVLLPVVCSVLVATSSVSYKEWFANR